jgi:capsular exopolysaccharide synthesis family protein
MTPRTPQSGDSPSLGLKLDQLVGALRKRAWMMAAIVITIPTVVGFVVSKRPKVFEATATMVIDSSVPQYLGAQFKDVVEIESNWWSSQETLQTELRVLRSHSQAVAVAEALCRAVYGKTKDQPLLPRIVPSVKCDDPKSVADIAPLLQGMITVTPARDSRVVSISARHNDPEITADIANAYADVYRERNLARRLAQSEGAARWLGDQYGDLMSQLRDADNALVEFKRKYGVLAVAIEDQQNDISNRHRKLSDELNAVQVKLIGLRTQREEYAKLRSDDPLTDLHPTTEDNGVLLRLKELYIEQYGKLVELRGKYLDKHPALVAQETRVQVIRQDLKREAELASKRAEATFQALVKQERELRAALDAATRDALQLEQRAVEYHRLKRNFDRLSKLSDQVGGRERESALAGHLKTNNVRILDYALIPTAAIAPNVTTAVVAALAIAIALAFGLALGLELLDSTVKTQDDIERAQLTFLGLVPTIDPTDKAPTVPPPPALASLVRAGSRDVYVLTHPKSAVAECCRAIRTNLLFMTPDKPAKTLLVTSAGPQEGKTTTAVNLAITFAQSGMRVLLVDTDMRRPRLHKAFGIPATPDGVSKAILGESEAATMVRETGIPNLYLLPCGAIPPNPAELLHAERFKTVLNELSEKFDRVIFDSPPICVVTDAAILSRLTEGTLVVARSGVTSKEALARACHVLGAGAVNVLGCVMNAVSFNKPGSYGYAYYSRYGYYDSEQRPNEAAQ